MPIGCAGWPVYPGDVLVGDRDGVLVIPAALAAEVAEPSLEQEKLEAFVSTKIHAGEPLWGNYPPGDEPMAEYKAARGRAARTARPTGGGGRRRVGRSRPGHRHRWWWWAVVSAD